MWLKAYFLAQNKHANKFFVNLGHAVRCQANFLAYILIKYVVEIWKKWNAARRRSVINAGTDLECVLTSAQLAWSTKIQRRDADDSCHGTVKHLQSTLLSSYFKEDVPSLVPARLCDLLLLFCAPSCHFVSSLTPWMHKLTRLAVFSRKLQTQELGSGLKASPVFHPLSVFKAQFSSALPAISYMTRRGRNRAWKH